MNLKELFMPEPGSTVYEEDPEYWEDKDEPGLIEVTLVEGSPDAHTTLMFFSGEWNIKMYSGYHISTEVRIGPHQVKKILEDVSSESIDEFEWTEKEWVFVE